MYDIEKYHQAEGIDDTVHAPSADPDVVVISGSSDVLIKIREGKLAGCSPVSIHGIRELEGVSMEEDGTIVIGLATTFSHITNNKIIREYISILGNAVDMVGGPQLCNIGAVGGNMCSGMTSADSTSNLYCLNAILVLTEPVGVRKVPVSGWYTGPGRTVRTHDEFLTSVKIKKGNCEGYDDHYTKYGKRGVMEIVTLSCAMIIKLSEDKRHIKDLRLGCGAAAPAPVRCHETERSVIGMETGDALAEKVGEGALSEISPRSSWRASKEFHLRLMEELGGRAVKQVVINAGGEWDV